jgi:hypothetical protein
VTAATDTNATIEVLLEVVHSVGSVLRLCDEDQVPLPVIPGTVRVGQSREESLQAVRQLRSEKLLAEAGDNSETQVRRWKPLPSSAMKTENTSLCVIVICKV